MPHISYSVGQLSLLHAASILGGPSRRIELREFVWECGNGLDMHRFVGQILSPGGLCELCTKVKRLQMTKPSLHFGAKKENCKNSE